MKLLGLLALAAMAEWPGFRGPNGSGVDAVSTNLPGTISPGAPSQLWRTAVPPGASSPVLTSNRIFLTAYEPGLLITLSIDRATGKIVWRRENSMGVRFVD